MPAVAVVWVEYAAIVAFAGVVLRAVRYTFVVVRLVVVPLGDRKNHLSVVDNIVRILVEVVRFQVGMLVEPADK